MSILDFVETIHQFANFFPRLYPLTILNQLNQPSNWVNFIEEQAHMINGHMIPIFEEFDSLERKIDIQIVDGTREKWLLKTNDFYRTEDIIRKYTSPTTIKLYRLEFNPNEILTPYHLIQFYKVFYAIKDQFDFYLDYSGHIYFYFNDDIRRHPQNEMLNIETLLSSTNYSQIDIIQLLYIITGKYKLDEFKQDRWIITSFSDFIGDIELVIGNVEILDYLKRPISEIYNIPFKQGLGALWIYRPKPQLIQNRLNPDNALLSWL